MWVPRSNKTRKKNKASEGVFSFWLYPLKNQISFTTKPGHRAHTSPTPQMMESYFWDSHQAFCWHQGESHSHQKLYTHDLHTRRASPLHCTNITFPDFTGKQWKCHTSMRGLFLYSTIHFCDCVWLPKKQSLGKIWLIMLSGWLSVPWVEFHGVCAHVGCTKKLK